MLVNTLFLKFRFYKPVFWKFFSAIAHVNSSKDAEREHLFWRKLGFEIRMEIPSHRFGKLVFITPLEFVVHFYSLSCPEPLALSLSNGC